MASIFPLLLYTSLGGGLLLLGMAAIPRLRPLHKPVTAGWLTLLAFLWLMLLQQGRWVLSVWSPGSVLGGQILLDMTPAVWWLGLSLTVIFGGVAWVEVAQHRDTPLLTGVLILVLLTATWLTLAAGSLLTMLAMWAVFDLAWGIAGLISGADADRVIFGLTLHGVASLLLWVVSLLLLQSGGSELWWLMWPSTPVLVLLLVAALMRVGFYPFQIVFPTTMRSTRSLSLLYFMGPLTGVALLYRLLLLPGLQQLPTWVTVWGILSLLWEGIMAWAGHRQRSGIGACHALFLGLVTGAGVMHSGSLLLRVAGLWVAAGALLMLARGRDRSAPGWIWPVWLAVLFLLGSPPSPVGTVLWTLLDVLPGALRLALWVGMILISAVFLQQGGRVARGAGTPPMMWQRVALGAGMMVVTGMLIAPAVSMEAGAFSWPGFVLWFLALLGAAALVRWGKPWRERLSYSQPLLEFFDLQWIYRSMWRGAEHLLSILRVSADVVEGSGSLLWSLLILLLVLLVVGNL
ncbi:MAG TPA: hypothetical protein PLH19_07240 [Anaerolineae bacterium]|nr:hypothetical protein [Anaerolineae bacterium]HQH38317.1 hypothetical protein [Anaerolineae bacterium]